MNEIRRENAVRFPSTTISPREIDYNSSQDKIKHNNGSGGSNLAKLLRNINKSQDNYSPFSNYLHMKDITDMSMEKLPKIQGKFSNALRIFLKFLHYFMRNLTISSFIGINFKSLNLEQNSGYRQWEENKVRGIFY